MYESPFLPNGRQWIWNATSLDAAICSRKYYYQVVLGLRSRKQSDDLTFGGHYAAALELYHYGRALDQDHNEGVRGAVRQTLINSWGWQSDHSAKTRENLIRTIVWYLEEYQDDPCETLILGDGRPAVELRSRFRVQEEIWFSAKTDRIVQYAGECYVQDQKTTSSTIGSYYFKRYSPNNQISLYSLDAKVTWNTPVRGVMIDAAQIAVGFSRFERGFAFRTEEQLEEWIDSAKFTIHKTWEASAKGWPMNEAACMMFGGCEFMEVCSKSPSVREAFLATGYVERRHSPTE